MKQYSDLQAIDSDVVVEMALHPVTENGVPGCCVSINDVTFFDSALTDPVIVRHRIPLLDVLVITVTMSNKIYREDRETAIIIDRLGIDDLEIVPDFLHHTIYHNDQNQDIKTNYLGFNGVWSLPIGEPFYRWRHRVTGQGWLLEPTAGSRDRFPRGTSSTTSQHRI